MDVSVLTSLIPVLVPVLIALAKMAVPKIPAVWLPVIAPVLGAGIELLGHFAGVSSGNPLVSAVLGSAGVGVREIFDQVKQRLGAPDA